MRRWLAHPLLAGFLLLAWVLLQQSLAPGTIVLGLLLALVLCRVLERLQPPAVRVRRPLLLLRLLLRVFGDIVRSNIAVATLLLSQRRDFHSGFVTIPLQLQNPYALAMLACIITSTPGTIWVSHDSRSSMLVIHVLDLVDEQGWIADIKQRYEQPLLEIFP
ncbi:MAG TPA: Na+/H+ antiporter subunit E [Salinisphaeraceae bacterium]|nr:Na+/H+ antiporter subunit E [Salinisphaeraceae bacterium]